MKYKAEIKFKDKKHCLSCPLRDGETDGCAMQIDEYECYLEFEDWESQMKNCPLEEI